MLSHLIDNLSNRNRLITAKYRTRQTQGQTMSLMENKTKPTPDRYKTSQNPLVKCNSQNHYHKRVQSASQIQNHRANNQTNKKWRLDPQLVRVTYSFCDKRKTHRKKANYISEKARKKTFLFRPKNAAKNGATS